MRAIEHLQKVSTRVSLRSPRRLTRVDTFCFLSIFVIIQSVTSHRAQSVAYRTLELEAAGSIRGHGQYFFQRLDDRIHSSLTAVHCFDDGYVGKQLVAWKAYCAECWLKELQESIDRCTGRSDIIEKLLKNGAKHHTINHTIDSVQS